MYIFVISKSIEERNNTLPVCFDFTIFLTNIHGGSNRTKWKYNLLNENETGISLRQIESCLLYELSKLRQK